MSLNRYSRKGNPLKPRRDLKQFSKFLGVAIVLMLLVDYGLFREGRPYAPLIKAQYYKQKAAQEVALNEALPESVHFDEIEGFDDSAALNDKVKDLQSLFPEKQLNITKLIPEKTIPIPQRKAKRGAVKPRSSAPKIAIVIDDVGMNLKQSHAAINLPAEVTLAMLPYAKTVRNLAKEAKKKGHELIIHTPMEAMNKEVSLGAMALRSGMDQSSFKAEFRKITQSFDGYVGVNNHMGSRLTQDVTAMNWLMEQLRGHNLYFLDSKTIASSVAAQVARQNNIPHATRDVFLDHEDTTEFVQAALKKTERIARKNGSAIAIGHPKAVTMQALKTWIPQAEKRGFNIVPLSRLIRHPKHENLLVKKAVVEEGGLKEGVPKSKVIVVNVERAPDQKLVMPKRSPVSYPVD